MSYDDGAGERAEVYLDGLIGVAKAYNAAESECRWLYTENEKLQEQIETLVMYVESDGTRYWVDDDGNQHFDHSATVKDDADKLRELVRDMWTCIQTADKSDNAWDECDRCILWNGNNNHRCEFGRRMKELGVEI